MSDLQVLKELTGMKQPRISTWAISLRLMMNRKAVNKGKVDPRKSRGEHRDMRCDLIGIFVEVMALMHLKDTPGASQEAIDFIQESLLHGDIRTRPDGEADFLLNINSAERTYADAKSYSVMKPYQTDTIKVNVEKQAKLLNTGCEYILFGLTRPFSTSSYFTGLVPMRYIGCKPWEHVKRDNKFNDYYSVRPDQFLKHGAELITDLYNAPQYNINDVEHLAFNSTEFDDYISHEFPKLRWKL